MSTLLFEIGTEELPAGFIQPALDQLKSGFCRKAEVMKIGHGDIRALATPRRLTLQVYDLADRQEDIREELIGPSTKAGLDDDGKPTKAAVGFARSKGADAGDLQIVATPKGDYLMLVRETPGSEVNTLLPGILQKLLVELTFPKSMRWGSNKSAFARPIQWLLAMNDSDTIVFEHEGIVSANVSRGHRFHNNHEVVIESPEKYVEQLADANVIVDQEKRKEMVVQTVQQAAKSNPELSNGKVFIDENLLDIVTHLVELPNGVCGSFDDKFLQLPDEVLVTSMREHQKYFPITDDEGKLLAGFVAVNNTSTRDISLTRQGHQRVLRARLEDALFFFKSDKERQLEGLKPQLQGIIFQAKLGTMLEKTERLVKLGKLLAEKLEPSQTENVCRAAELCKIDLLTDMVGEFPSLQGVMGQVYADFVGEDSQVALAIKEHYMPKRAGAPNPTGKVGALVGLADRIDTLAGCFGIGQIPTGTADPFGLRRIALTILQIIQEFDYSLSLREVLHKALALYGDRVDGSSGTVDTAMSFIENRYKNDCISKGYSGGVVTAALAAGFDDVNDCTRRVAALAKMQTDKNFEVLASAYKRTRNITKDNSATDINQGLLVESAEKNLFNLLQEVREDIAPKLAAHDYMGALAQLLKMKEPIDLFFDEVMVMTEDENLRQNRLNLLTAFGELVLSIGDISHMHDA